MKNIGLPKTIKKSKNNKAKQNKKYVYINIYEYIYTIYMGQRRKQF